LTGASQLSSSLFLDEPTIGVMNRIGLEFNAVGNHEFDRGAAELQRLQFGGCEQYFTRTPCAVEPAFGGARFTYLAANVEQLDGTTLFPGSALRHFGNGRGRVAIGLIGLTLKETPSIVSAGGVEGLTFTDEAETINAAASTLKLAGADAVVVLVHQGVAIGGERDPNGCEDAAGPMLEIVSKLDPAIDLVVSGHTHQAYICELPGSDGQKLILLTSAGSYGTMLTDIRMTVDPEANRVTALEARNAPVQSLAFGTVAQSFAAPIIEPRADIADYVATYVAAAAEFSERPVGRLAPLADSGSTSRAPTGQLIADAQVAATSEAGAQFSLMNPGGVRNTLQPAADGSLTFGDLYAVQPFGNDLVTLTLSGAQLIALLESQFTREDGRNLVLFPSAGFSYEYDLSKPAGSRVAKLTLDGVPVDPARDYRLTVNSFLAEGGDGFPIFKEGRDRAVGPGDLDALEAWLSGEALRALPVEFRARDVTPE
ncbi:MAG TPA: bifunctional metallophosphatase/5'-nucleotidase, partial [Sphingomonadaceae bacterium]|nr:bifunctional metallophosphatase/5'-nucleotidase [Sphingomonadaceae bacterium]